MKYSKEKDQVSQYMDKIAGQRDYWIQKNRYYYEDLKTFFKYNIPDHSTVLEIGCGTGDLLFSLNPKQGTGIDLSSEMISIARKKYPSLEFFQMDAENLELKEKFDYIIISDTLGYFEDVQKAFNELHKVSTPDTRIIITYHNFLWLPILNIAESLGLKMSPKHLNWLNLEDISKLLQLTNFDIIKMGRRFLLPKRVPYISDLVNQYIANLPVINQICITGYIIARPLINHSSENKLDRVSVVIPARNEAGNIEKAINRIPVMGKHTEIIFVEGHSRDNTLKEIQRVCKVYGKKIDVTYTLQDGEGKGDAVRKGFAMAKGDILMILDADLTVPPEALPKFYDAISTGQGEYINGTRLVYPMENEAMRTLNLAGNKFFSMMFSWLLGQRIKDTLCGTKVISKKNYERLMANRSYFGDFDPFGDFDLIFGSAKLNLKLVEIPIRYKAREYGSTNISRFKHGWLLLKMVLFALNKVKFI